MKKITFNFPGENRVNFLRDIYVYKLTPCHTFNATNMICALNVIQVTNFEVLGETDTKLPLSRRKVVSLLSNNALSHEFSHLAPMQMSPLPHFCYNANVLS